MHMIPSGLLRFLTGALMCVTVVCPFAAWAQHEVFVNINGELKKPACTPSIQGQMMSGTNNQIILPDVYTADLPQGGRILGSAATLHFRAQGCTGNVNNMWVFFSSPTGGLWGIIKPVNEGSCPGYIFKIHDNNAQGSEVWVLGSAESPPGPLHGTAVPFSGSHPTNSDRVANKYYVVMLHKPSGTQFNVPANCSATVTANFKYY